MSTKKTVEEIYSAKTVHRHILDLPDTWIGSIGSDNLYCWIYNSEINKMIFKEISYIPGLLKIFDEIIVNARDQSVRDKTCKTIHVTINKNTGQVSVFNDGNNGIPIEWHNVEKCYVPTMIFGKELTGSNFDKKGKTVGGKNGIGAKAANIWSTEFIVEVVDKKNKFTQRFHNNMFNVDEPIIVPGTNKSCYTKITFTPDYKRFGVEEMSNDIYDLFTKRVYDIAATTNVTVSLNGKEIKMNKFEDYVKMFYSDEEEINDRMVYIDQPRWKVAVVFDNDTGFRQSSYVNGVCTLKGGSHVRHVVDQVVGKLKDKIIEKLPKKNKDIKIKASTIRDFLTFFIDSVIEDPSFDSQAKENLTSKVDDFGSRCVIDDKTIDTLMKKGIYQAVVSLSEFNAMNGMKKSDGKKTQKISAISKLDDAAWAGTKRSHLCTLILVEGDSAKSFALNGREVIGVDRCGVFPLKGKLLNVREATAAQLEKNEEITNIKKIMGLKHKMEYKSVSQLRYGRILILTDQDYDGSHIKGLIMNFIHFFWPSLLEFDGFISTLSTPIVKVFDKNDTRKINGKEFYTLTDFENWMKDNFNKNKHSAPSYYKGLGTSSPYEAKQIFQNFDQKVIAYVKEYKDEYDNIQNKEEEIEDIKEDDTKSEASNDDNQIIDKSHESHQAILLGFSKTQITARKGWLKYYDRENIIDQNSRVITFHDFIHKDLKHFSNYDIERSIPSICDGMKPSQRKILYAGIHKNINTAMKVSQFAGLVAQETDYHHGEQSLMGAIAKMAQQFVGTNNINLFVPLGAFGTRTDGGKKTVASPRYIHTMLNKLSQYIFKHEDSYVLDYVEVEPNTYAPIICMELVNGTEGIGTGFSNSCPPYNVIDIIANIIRFINKEEMVPMVPYFHGFTGRVKMTAKDKYETYGVFEILDENRVMITELPIYVWTNKYKKYLEALVEDGIIQEIKCHKQNFMIQIEVIFVPGKLVKLRVKDGLDTILKLVSKGSITNLHFYDANGRIKKYDDPLHVLQEFCEYRYGIYVKRKERYLKVLSYDLSKMGYIIKFMKDVRDGTIIVFEKNKVVKKQMVIDKLIELNYPQITPLFDSKVEKKSYDYLTGIKIFDFTEEELAKIQKDYIEKQTEYTTYSNTTIEELWLNDLNKLEKEYHVWLEDRIEMDKMTDDLGTVQQKNKKKRLRR